MSRLRAGVGGETHVAPFTGGPVIVMIIATGFTYSADTAFHTSDLSFHLSVPVLQATARISWKPLFPLIQTHMFSEMFNEGFWLFG